MALVSPSSSGSHFPQLSRSAANLVPPTRANPAQSKSLAVWYGRLVVVRVAAGGVKVLVGSCWFGVEVRFDVPIDDGDLRVKELDS